MLTSKENSIIDAAHAVFLRYGFKRVTMGDIAEAAGISRPAVYLLFSSKEAVFKAVVKKINQTALTKIKAGFPEQKTLIDKLLFAFDIWTIQPHEMVKQSADAKELIQSTAEFASDVLEESGAIFESILVDILQPAINHKKTTELNAKKIAHLMRGAARGMKEVAKNTNELRELVKQFISLMLKGLSLT